MTLLKMRVPKMLVAKVLVKKVLERRPWPSLMSPRKDLSADLDGRDHRLLHQLRRRSRDGRHGVRVPTTRAVSTGRPEGSPKIRKVGHPRIPRVLPSATWKLLLTLDCDQQQQQSALDTRWRST